MSEYEVFFYIVLVVIRDELKALKAQETAGQKATVWCSSVTDLVAK